jgi:hypothetical protein
MEGVGPSQSGTALRATQVHSVATDECVSGSRQRETLRVIKLSFMLRQCLPVCRTTCGGESRCQAYTWVKSGIQGPSGHCWLKDTLPDIVKDACCDSGPRGFISKRDLVAENNINRPGSDFKNFVTDRWNTCEAACAEDEICASWTYVRPGVQGPAAHCWSKNRVARPVPDGNTISGVKFKLPSVRFD